MWRKQEEPKPSSPAAEPVAPTSVSTPAKVEVPAPMPKAVAPREATPPPGGHLTQGLKIKGEVTGGEDLYIDGEVHGQIRLAEAKVTIGARGRVMAGVEAREAVVRGELKGDLHVRERVQIDSTASVAGDVVTRRICIDEGARLRGHVDTTRPEERRTAKTQSPVASAVETVPAPVRSEEPAKESMPTT